MAPLHKAIRVQYARQLPEGVFVYHGHMDEDWTVLAVPNGGYVLGLVIEATIQHQTPSNHPDPIHVTGHFLKSTVVGPFEVHIRILKTGRSFTNVSAQLVQHDQCRVMSHIIHGVLTPPAASTEPCLTIAPPSPYARQIPMYTHPSKCPRSAMRPKWTYKGHIALANDPVHVANTKNLQKGLEFGMYVTLNDQQERITPSSLAFMSDTFAALDRFIPGLHKNVRKTSWAPTMVMTIEFKFPIPKPSSEDHSPRTVAIFSAGKFMNDPQGRHDVYVEVWTAPSDIGDGIEKDNWKETQRCLAVSTQMALLLPAEVNKKLGNRGVKL